MTWRECGVVISRRHIDTVSAVLHAHGAAGVQEDFVAGEAPPPRQPWDTGPTAPLPPRALLRGWFEQVDEASLSRALVVATQGDPLAETPTWSAVVPVDYEAVFRAQFAPLVISDRLVVCPPWQTRPGCLIIEPGQGFGTGDHPTTELALRALDACVTPGTRVLDVGSGSGILALAVVLLGGTALGIDTDDDAVRDACKNADANGLSVPFETTPLSQTATDWDVVVANVHAEVLVTLADDLVQRAKQRLILGGILADREVLVRQAFDRRMTLVARHTQEDWVGLTYEPRA